MPRIPGDHNLRIHRELHSEAGLAEGLYLRVRSRLLSGKVIRRKATNHQTLLAVRFIKRFEPRILRRETALRRNVDDQQNLALMFGKRGRSSVDALDRDIENWKRSSCAHKR